MTLRFQETGVNLKSINRRLTKFVEAGMNVTCSQIHKLANKPNSARFTNFCLTKIFQIYSSGHRPCFLKFLIKWGSMVQTFRGRFVIWLLYFEFQFWDGIEALPEMRLYSQWVPGLSQNLQQFVIGQEIESESFDIVLLVISFFFWQKHVLNIKGNYALLSVSLGVFSFSCKVNFQLLLEDYVDQKKILVTLTFTKWYFLF